jgi:signal transduction histidine kinase
MTRRILLTYLTITALALAALAVPLGLTFTARERERIALGLERDAVAAGALVEESLEHGRSADVGRLLASFDTPSGARVEVVDRAGARAGDSDAEGPDLPAAGLERALAGNTVDGEFDAAGDLFRYAAVPISSGGVVHGAARASIPAARVDDEARGIWAGLAGLAGLVLLVVAGVGFLLARGVTRPVRRLEDAAARLAAGELDARVEITGGAPELRSLASTFNSTAQRLGKLVEAQQSFVADAAHELRTPLTALRLRLENLEHALPEDELDKLDAAVGEVSRLTRIVDGLLALARNADRSPPAEPVDLAAITAARVEAWEPIAAEERIALALEVPPGTCARAPAGSVEQILDNLVANALTACSAGGTVLVGCAPGEDGSLVLRVTDDGRGLDATERERAFDRFWRADRRGPGTGLGLAIVRQLARAAGGDAHLEANPAGRGTVAVVRLPGVVPPPRGEPDRPQDAHPPR